MPKNRMPRVEELIKREVSLILTKDLCIPEIGFITITYVSVSKDLKHAHIHVSVFGDEKKQEKTLKLLTSQAHNIFQILKTRIRMKYIPHLTFYLDHSAEYSDHINRRLIDINKEDKENPEDLGNEKV